MIYANVGPDGIIVFEPHADPGLNRLPIGSARDEDTERFKRAISWSSEWLQGMSYDTCGI